MTTVVSTSSCHEYGEVRTTRRANVGLRFRAGRGCTTSVRGCALRPFPLITKPQRVGEGLTGENRRCSGHASESGHGEEPKVLRRARKSGWRESNPRSQLGRLELYH